MPPGLTRRRGAALPGLRSEERGASEEGRRCLKALAEAFLAPLHAAGLPERQTALGFRLIYDYTIGFALSDRTTASEQRVQDAGTRRELHAFVRSLPADRFPVLAAIGEHIWVDDRDERFAASLATLVNGLQAARQPQ